MASGALVEGGGGGDVPRERNRWIENKVYTRKFYKRKPKNDTNVTDESQAPSSSNAPSTQTVASEDGKKEQHQQQQEPLATVQENGVGVASKEDVERPVENGPGSGLVQTTESHVNIHLTSMSKEEIREVKQKLVDELEKIRDLLKQVEAKEMEVNGNGDLDVDGCRVVDVVGVDGSVVVADGMDVSQLSANGDHANDAVVDNGGARSMVSEVNLESGDAKKMVPEVSLDNVYSGRMSTEFSLDDGDAEPMIPEVSLNHGSGRTMMPEVSLDNGDGRSHFSEMDFGNGVARTMTPRANLHNGGVRRMLPVVNVDSYSGSRMGSEVTSLGKREPPRSLHQLRVSVMENNGLNEYADKEKRTPKANQFYQNSDFIVGKEKFPPPSKKLKTNGSRKHGRAGNRAYGFGLVRHSGQVFKHCSSLLTKLMKHRHGWVFNTPVDVEGLRLHDYYLIIKHPMDLGTVKSKLNANFYRSPREFAEDVRLTFRNARTYNPEGQDVHIMAQQLSHIFEERWATMEIEYNLDAWYESYPEVSLPTPVMNKPPYLPSDVGRYIERVDLTPQQTHPKPKAVHYGSSGRGTALKKPKAKDQNKRAMTYDEKQKLSTHLQSLPTEKLDNIVEIIKRRNTSLLQHDNEIEVDIDAVDTETLWELDRFVTNYKKSLSKYKRKAELAMQARQQAELNAQNHTPVAVALSKETKTADEKNTASPQPHQADKQQDNNSRSSSSSSSSSDSSSSSSDSDSDSSSDSDNEQQSPRN